METDYLVTVATAAALTWATGALFALFRFGWRHPAGSLFYAAASMAAVLGVVWMDSVASLGRHSVVSFVQPMLKTDLRHLCLIGLGITIGIGPAMWPWQSAWSRRARGMAGRLRKATALLAIGLSFVFIGFLALEDEVKPFLVDRGLSSIITNPMGGARTSGVVVEEYHSCGFRPVQITVAPDGTLYATGYKGPVAHGIVARLSQNRKTGHVSEEHIARNLTRLHGIAVYDGDLYVSRSGHFLQAKGGRLRGVNTGAVTLLRDLDGNGTIDYYHDVLDDLPGVQGPDQLHQNNGIAFSPDGYLYVGVGVPANRAPTISEFEGTVVRCRPDGSEKTVFARGFRNPFDLTFGPDGQLFCTDNDAADRRTGDELNWVQEGRHYGFPYADGSTQHPEGTAGPLLVNKKGTFQGIAYADSPNIPPEFRNCLYVVSFGNGNIHRVRLRRTGSTYRAESTVVATVPGALDLAVSEEGVMYVACFETAKIYRLTFAGTTGTNR